MIVNEALIVITTVAFVSNNILAEGCSVLGHVVVQVQQQRLAIGFCLCNGIFHRTNTKARVNLHQQHQQH
jgi:hypothetical protein